MSRYHPLLVTLHWLLAVMIIATLVIGRFELAATPNTNPQKIDILRWHMAGGTLILALMAIRFIVRKATSRPAAATTGNPFADRIAPLTHCGSYALVFLMAATGLTTAIVAGLPEIVFGGSGDPLPPTFMIYPPRILHGFLAAMFIGVILLHILAALYHQLIRRDRLLRRMSFGRRVASPSAPAD